MDGLHVLEVRAMGSAWICRQSGLTQMDNHNHTCVTAGGCCTVSCVVGQKHRGNLHQFHIKKMRTHTEGVEQAAFYLKEKTAVRPIITAGFWRIERRIRHVFAFYLNNKTDYYDLLPTSQFIISHIFKPPQLFTALKTNTAPECFKHQHQALCASAFYWNHYSNIYERSHDENVSKPLSLVI